LLGILSLLGVGRGADVTLIGLLNSEFTSLDTVTGKLNSPQVPMSGYTKFDYYGSAYYESSTKVYGWTNTNQPSTLALMQIEVSLKPQVITLSTSSSTYIMGHVSNPSKSQWLVALSEFGSSNQENVTSLTLMSVDTTTYQVSTVCQIQAPGNSYFNKNVFPMAIDYPNQVIYFQTTGHFFTLSMTPYSLSSCQLLGNQYQTQFIKSAVVQDGYLYGLFVTYFYVVDLSNGDVTSHFNDITGEGPGDDAAWDVTNMNLYFAFENDDGNTLYKLNMLTGNYTTVAIDSSLELVFFDGLQVAQIPTTNGGSTSLSSSSSTSSITSDSHSISSKLFLIYSLVMILLSIWL